MHEEEEQLENLLAKKKRSLAQKYNGQLLDRNKVVFQIQFESAPSFYLCATKTDFHFLKGQAVSPDITLYFDQTKTLWDAFNQNLDFDQIFLESRYRSDGEIVLSQIFLYLFKK
tara:strand:- start:13 stop:354 length:342 start_codon:yes stop_codon:yes gene_type:complete